MSTEPESDLSTGHESVEVLIGREPQWIVRSGIGIVFATLLLLACVSWYIRFPDALHARIELTGVQPPTELVARKAARLHELRVQDGDLVARGQIIGIFEDDTDASTVLGLHKILKGPAYTANPADTIKWTDIEPFIDKDLGALRVAFDALAASLQRYQDSLSTEERYDAVADDRALQNEYAALADSLQAKRRTLQRRLTLKEQELDGAARLEKRGLIPKARLRELDEALLQIASSLEDVNVELRLNAVRRRELAQQHSIDIMRRNEQRKLRSLDVLSARAALLEAVEAWRLENLIESPVDGKVSLHRIWSANQYVTSGTVVARIASDTDRMVGMIKLDHRGAGKIREGQRVDIEIDSFPVSEFGYLRGEVAGISSIASHEGYTISVSLPSVLTTSSGFQIEDRPMMVGTAKIITADRRLIQRLLDRLLSTSR
ncbi:MAG: HlyD family efflux transporter periplasmic adaptor subunit [Pseudomonadota bacterium]